LLAGLPTLPRLVPAGNTDDQPRQVPDFAEQIGSQLRAQRRISAGFPFNRPRSAKAPKVRRRVGGTLVGCLATALPDGLSNCTADHYDAAMTANHTRLLAVLSAILLAAALRLVPHPPNFTPIAAMALFGGAMFGRRWLAFVAPLGALLLSDLALGFYPELAVVYLSTGATVAIGWALTKRRTALGVAAAALASSLLFFAVTNLGVWLVMDYYPKTLAGLAACYVAAIPFFQNTRAGDLFFSALLFGGFALAERRVPVLRTPELRPA
jgi:hypothetical protein